MTSPQLADRPIIFDAYAWVEYAADGPHAPKVNGILAEHEEIYTPASVIAELRDSMLKKGIPNASIQLIIRYIEGKSRIIGISLEVAELAGEINFQQKKTVKGWGMLDSFVYAVAKSLGGVVLTGDSHFKGLRDVIYLADDHLT